MDIFKTKVFKNVTRVSALSLVGLGLSGSLVMADSSGAIDTTGPGSDNSIETRVDLREYVRNTNKVDVDNRTHQHARTGNAMVRSNTTGGDAASGSAVNDNYAVATAYVYSDTHLNGSNGHDQHGSIEMTGPDSDNHVYLRADSRTDVRNTNHVNIDNRTRQTAHSGTATVKHNNSGGDAISGHAINDNTMIATSEVGNHTHLNGSNGHDQHGSIEMTGPDSDNQVDARISSRADVRNYSRVYIDNHTTQNARSGNALVYQNTTGGSAMSGDAANYNFSDILVGVHSHTSN